MRTSETYAPTLLTHITTIDLHSVEPNLSLMLAIDDCAICSMLWDHTSFAFMSKKLRSERFEVVVCIDTISRRKPTTLCTYLDRSTGG